MKRPSTKPTRLKKAQSILNKFLARLRVRAVVRLGIIEVEVEMGNES